MVDFDYEGFGIVHQKVIGTIKQDCQKGYELYKEHQELYDSIPKLHDKQYFKKNCVLYEIEKALGIVSARASPGSNQLIPSREKGIDRVIDFVMDKHDEFWKIIKGHGATLA